MPRREHVPSPGEGAGRACSKCDLKPALQSAVQAVGKLNQWYEKKGVLGQVRANLTLAYSGQAASRCRLPDRACCGVAPSLRCAEQWPA